MSPFSQRLSEISSYYANGDNHLGYRRLLDAAIETSDHGVYQHTLDFADWYDGIDPVVKKAEAEQKIKDLLVVIANGYREPGTAPQVKLKAENISKTYFAGGFSLSPTNVDLHNGRIIGLVGENGNGKTTLLRLLYGELKPDSGRIVYQFTAPSHTLYDTKALMAFVPQRPSVWFGSLMDNLQFASTYAGYRGKENFLWTEMIIARMGLRPYREYTWGRISSGYKMRFELARTLLRRPEVLLLDEPLANLDVLAQQVILEDLRFLAQSHAMPLSIILSSQQLYEVEKVSDEVIFLQKGVSRQQAIRNAVEQEKHPLVIELETSASREQLQQMLQQNNLRKISFNGGVYILYFDEGTSLGDVFTILGREGLPVKYLRDISISSRRFFDA